MRGRMAELLAGKRILVVEDEYMLASELAQFLEQQGAAVAGPAGTVKGALALVEKEPLDGAVLDVNLRNEKVYPVADALIARDVPIVFATGYEELLMARPYIGLPRCQKPIDKAALARALACAIAKQPCKGPGAPGEAQP
jgi:CheY-like chemotaxis protein